MAMSDAARPARPGARGGPAWDPSGVAAPLDRARSGLLRAALSTRPLGWWLEKRDRRVALLATLHLLVAFPLAVFAPGLLLVAGPLLLGVPHIAGDLRYLVLRRQVPAYWKRALWGICATLVLLRVAEETRVLGPLAGAEMLLVGLWLVAAALSGAGKTLSPRVLLVLGAVLALSCLLLVSPRTSRLVVAHGHNLVGIAIWLVLFRRNRKAVAVPMALLALAVAWCVTGGSAVWTLEHGWLEVANVHTLFVADWLAPGAPTAYAVGITSAYALLQSVHYAVWLGYIPQDDMRAEGTLTFRMSLRSLFADFGGWALAGLLVIALVVLAYGWVAPWRTRGLFLSVSSFHAYFEVAMVVFFASRAAARGPAAAAPGHA